MNKIKRLQKNNNINYRNTHAKTTKKKKNKRKNKQKTITCFLLY